METNEYYLSFMLEHTVGLCSQAIGMAAPCKEDVKCHL